MISIPGWTGDVWALLAPQIVVSGAALLLLALELVVGKEERRFPWFAVSGPALGVALWVALGRWGAPLPEAESVLGGAVRMDALAVFLYVLVLVAAGLSLATADGYLDRAGRRQPAAFHALALFSVAGMLLLVSAGDLVTLFLGLELLSFPTYVLCAYRRDTIPSSESALKYFVLGSFASSVFLYGVALVWGAAGTTSLAAVGAAAESDLLHLGVLLLLVGFLFKIGAAPFHMWVPDVYEGAPTPVTAFMATAVKVAAFGAFLRVFAGTFVGTAMPLARVLWWVACLTMVVGNLSALTQDNIKRMLAFSSVAHAGYMLVGLTAVAASGWDTGAGAVLYYLLVYVFLSVGSFTLVTLLGRRVEGDLQFERDWSGAARRHPFLGAAAAVFLLGLGGIPPTGGFFAKYSLFKAALDAGLTSLVVIAVLNSLVSVVYYLRVVVALYMRPERAPAPAGMLDAAVAGGGARALEGPGAMAAGEVPAPRLAAGGMLAAKIVVALSAVLTLWLGMGPSLGGLPGIGTIVAWTETAAASLR